MTNLYAIFDDKEDVRAKQGAFEVDYEKALILNKEGYGIFFTPNSFNGKRQKKNISKINYWIVDIDEGNKNNMLEKIKNLILQPSMIVETKRGYHLYWKSLDATKEKYEEIENLLIVKMNGDKGVKDYTRLLRCPNFYHMKDKNNPFLVKVIKKNDDLIYSEKQMIFAFSDTRIKKLKPLKEKKINLNDTEEIIKRIGTKNLNMFNENSGRRNFLLKKIGCMKHLDIDVSMREDIIRIINSRFGIPLLEDEINVVLRTTRN